MIVASVSDNFWSVMATLGVVFYFGNIVLFSKFANRYVIQKTKENTKLGFPLIAFAISNTLALFTLCVTGMLAAWNLMPFNGSLEYTIASISVTISCLMCVGFFPLVIFVGLFSGDLRKLFEES